MIARSNLIIQQFFMKQRVLKARNMLAENQDVVFTWPLSQKELQEVFAPPISIGKVDKIVIHSANLVSNGMLYFSRANWTNLTKLFLCTPQHINRIWSRHVAIKNISCKILSQTPLPNLQMIKLSSSDIDCPAAKHLAKAKWPNLESFKISRTNFSVDSMRQFVKAKWPKIKSIRFEQTDLTPTELVRFLLIDAQQLNTVEFIIHTMHNIIEKRLNYVRIQEENVYEGEPGYDGPITHDEGVAYTSKSDILLYKQELEKDKARCREVFRHKWNKNILKI